MAVDLGLVAAVLTMAIRWMKSSRAQALLPQTLELEAALRNLIAEAEVAGRHLNDQLLRRENNIQKYLAELEESERRITRSVVEGEEVSKRIEGVSETAQARLQELMAARDGRMPSPRARQAEESAPRTEQRAPQVATQQPSAKKVQPSQDAASPAVRTPVQKRAVESQRNASPAAAQGVPARQPAPGAARSAQAYGNATKRDTAELHAFSVALGIVRNGAEIRTQAGANTRVLWHLHGDVIRRSVRGGDAACDEAHQLRDLRQLRAQLIGHRAPLPPRVGFAEATISGVVKLMAAASASDIAVSPAK